MPRKQRVEYAGATYHILSRGNYRKDLFTVGESGSAFEKALLETVKRCGWELYAYVIMSNHYHLAIRTPEPNLVAGMKWLQSTFATRFNHFTGERGHVFQGRYKSFLLTENQSLGGLVDYIHLNPVRAKKRRLAELEKHPLSSFTRYLAGEAVATGLQRKAMLKLHGLPNTKRGMERYRDHLGLVDESKPRKREELAKRYCRGWFIGSKEAVKRGQTQNIKIE
jgi:putative transposase